MSKKLKSKINNQWTSLPEDSCKSCCSCNKKCKTATNNEWTSTLKNNVTNCSNNPTHSK